MPLSNHFPPFPDHPEDMKSLAKTKDTADEISSAAQAIPEAQAAAPKGMMEETPTALQETSFEKEEVGKTPILQEQMIVDRLELYMNQITRKQLW